MRPSRTERPLPHPLILVDTIDVGGTGKGVLQLARGLRGRGVDVTVANFRYRGRPSAFSAAAREAGLPFVELEQAYRLDVRCIAMLADAAAARGCNVLESHSFKAHLVAWRLRTRLGLPWVAHAHGWTSESRRVHLYNALERRLLRAPEHVCVVSPQLESDLLAAGRAGPVTVLRNGVEASPHPIPPHERRAARATLGLGASARVFAVIGRLSHEKGVDLLVEAVARPALREVEVQVYVAGHGPERERLEALARRLGVDARLRFLGQVRDPRALMAASDALVLPSRSEGVPNVALEAVDAGVPVIATRVGTLPEIVLHGVTGWLVPPCDPAALADALQRAAVLDPTELAATGLRARALVLPQFSAERRVTRALGIYEDLLGGGAGTGRRVRTPPMPASDAASR